MKRSKSLYNSNEDIKADVNKAMTTEESPYIGAQRRKINSVILERVPRTNDLVTSLFQLDLFLEDLAHHPSIYTNCIHMWEVTGCTNQELLCRAFEEAILNHEIFRTCFASKRNGIFQKIAPKEVSQYRLEVVDLSHLNNSGIELELKRIFRETGYAPFELTESPLFRAKLIKLNNDAYALLIAVHHSIWDWKTAHNLLDEVSERFGALRKGVELINLKPKFEYADFAAWERKTIVDNYGRENLDYWAKLTSQCPESIRWPNIKPRPDHFGNNINVEYLEMQDSMANAIRKIGKELGASTYQINLAVFLLFLHRLTREADVLVGSSIDMRRFRDLPKIMGAMANDFVIRSQIKHKIAFSDYVLELIQQTKKSFVAADVDYSKIVEQSKVNRRPNIYPLTQVVFLLFTKSTMCTSEILKFKHLLFDSGGGEVDLICQMIENESSINIGFRYNADLFDQSTIKTMMIEFLNFYDRIINGSNKTIHDIIGTDLKTINNSAENNVPKLAPSVVASELENFLGKLWMEILKVPKVDLTDDFFSVGGNMRSLYFLYQRLLELGYNISFSDLCENTNVIALANAINSKGTSHPKKSA